MMPLDILCWGLVLVRTAACLAFLAPLSGSSVPAPVKIGLSVALACLWAPQQSLTEQRFDLTSEAGLLAVGWLAIRETCLGIALAWILGLMFVPLKVAGAFLGQELGLTLAGLTSPLDQQPSNVVAQLIEGLGTLCFFAVDGHHLLLRAVDASWRLIPAGGSITAPSMSWLLRTVSGAERAGLELAAPVGVGLLVVTAFSLLVMRSAPQFNLMTFGMPLKLLLGLGLLLTLLPELLLRIVEMFGRASPFGGAGF